MTMTNNEKTNLMRELKEQYPPDIARAIYNATVNPPEAVATPLAGEFKKLETMTSLLRSFGEPDQSLAAQFVQQGLSADQARAILRERQLARQWQPHLEAAQARSRWGLPDAK